MGWEASIFQRCGWCCGRIVDKQSEREGPQKKKAESRLKRK